MLKFYLTFNQLRIFYRPSVTEKEVCMANRKEIIAAAKASFVKYGIVKTTLDIVARECDVQKTAIYYYFKNKDDLIQSTLEDIVLETKNEFDKLLEFQGDFRSRLQHLMQGQLESFLKRKHFMVTIRNIDIQSKFIQFAIQIRDDLFNYLHQNYFTVLQEGIKEGLIKSDYIDPAIQIITRSITSYAYEILVYDKEIPVSQITDQTLDVVLNGIKA